ncbi:TetR/AcrR family transcriptional regulator [Actinomycetospora sp. TBRC 11914]|uniref:TetR/AcrR family transcriptional regulator n=1 Tax=Actinomycetospora sp. TBRC 11914 TaxID=2729387 RepID=UPI00145C5B96|nr:TetR/AcrR family transcriptional regulator [Actinomycetospora sp. TBRC 11914]NMO92170.1 TetR/AcrR family transcriptional regulator [Actinomycetospora sp. TBRC 11914]
MGRWVPGARGRLQRAAFELFAERGFEQTTVAEIAARAELTERTFFRHFTDKREVLFAGQDELTTRIVAALAAAPAELSALDAAVVAVEASAEVLGPRPDGPRARQTVIDAHPELRERELIKMEGLVAAIAEGLGRRGVPAAAASLAASSAVAVFRMGFERWIGDDGGRGVEEHIREALVELREVAGAS